MMHRTELEAVLSTCVSVAVRPAMPASDNISASVQEPIASSKNLPPFADPAAPAMPEI